MKALTVSERDRLLDSLRRHPDVHVAMPKYQMVWGFNRMSVFVYARSPEVSKHSICGSSDEEIQR